MAHQRSPVDGIENQKADLFRACLDEMIDMAHSLVRVSQVMPWDALIEQVGSALPQVPTGAGRRPLLARLVLGLLYLKYAYDLSDEAVCARWLENPYYQYFCGEVFFQTRLPCDPSSLTRYRQRLGEAGVEELLEQTIEAARHLKATRRSDLKRIIVDATVQEKDVAFPTDSRLLEVARGKQRTLLGRLIRDIQRKASVAALERLASVLEKAERLRTQVPKDKNKLYAWHAPEVECIGKGKARQPYEFGVKVGIAITAKKGLIVGARSFPGNPYDGDTLAEHDEQTGILTGVAWATEAEPLRVPRCCTEANRSGSLPASGAG